MRPSTAPPEGETTVGTSPEGKLSTALDGELDACGAASAIPSPATPVWGLSGPWRAVGTLSTGVQTAGSARSRRSSHRSRPPSRTP